MELMGVRSQSLNDLVDAGRKTLQTIMPHFVPSNSGLLPWTWTVKKRNAGKVLAEEHAGKRQRRGNLAWVLISKQHCMRKKF